MKLKLGNLFSKKDLYLKIGGVVLASVAAGFVIKRMTKQADVPAMRARSYRSSINTRNQPGMLDEDWPTTWLPEPYIERKTDKNELNKLPLTNIVPTPIKPVTRFIGASGFETSCNTGIGKQWY